MVNDVKWDYVTTRGWLNKIEGPWLRRLAEEVAAEARVLGASSVDTGHLLGSIHVEMLHHGDGQPVAQVQASWYGIFLDDTFAEHAVQMVHNHPLLTTALLHRAGLPGGQ